MLGRMLVDGLDVGGQMLQQLLTDADVDLGGLEEKRRGFLGAGRVTGLEAADVLRDADLALCLC